MTIVNVRAKEGAASGYSFEVNTPEKPLTNIAYLNENKVKYTLLKEKATLIEKEYKMSYEEKRGHFLMGMGATTFPIMANFLNKEMAIVTTAGTIKHIDIMAKLLPIVHLIQDLALPLSIIIASWGCIEWIIGSPGWKHKLKGAIIGLISIYFIPFGFMAIADALSHLG